ncbi:MAG: hypothetical protein KI790_21125, partial [Cyclobacteriaceae bacterium]|nr:hypothetical protein [Cyclobacteriaceae bacterium HetDA_MAG_MS6]
MLKRFLILIAVLLLVGAAYFTYDKWIKSGNLTVWSYIPEEAALVFESSSLLSAWSGLDKHQSGKTLRTLPYFLDIQNAIQKLDSIVGKESIENLIEGNQSLISLHTTSKNAFDFLFVLEINTIKQHNVLSEIQEFFRQNGYRKKSRSYLNFSITEVSDGHGTNFTYIFHKNFFIGSTTAFLVEDAIRTVSDPKLSSFYESFAELQPITKLDQDLGNLYLNLEGFLKFLTLFGEVDISTPAISSFLDVKVEDNSLNFDGFTFADLSSSFLNQFTGVTPSTFDLSEVIPLTTAVFHHYAFDNPSGWSSRMKATLPESLQKKKQELLKKVDFDVDYVYELIDQEIGLAQAEGIAGEWSRTLFLEVKDAQNAARFFDGVIKRFRDARRDSIFQEKFKGFTVKYLPAPDFPATLIGKAGQGFENCYYTTYRNYVLFSNSLPGIKNVVNSILEENTWRKSLRRMQFLNRTNVESNYSLYVNVPQFWEHLLQVLAPKWRNAFRQNDYFLKTFENIAFQFNAVDDKFFTNVIVHQPEGISLDLPTVTTVSTLNIVTPIASKPFIVTNHNDQTKEVFLQDSADVVYLVGSDMNVLWTKALPGKIRDDVRQIDYYRNGKLQLAFIVNNEFHILDRTGEYLPGYPAKIANRTLEYFEVIDYDGDRKYRFSFADIDGRVYLTNKSPKALNGWNPKDLKARLNNGLRHYRLGGRDVMITTQKEGKIHLFKRVGTHYSGFPLDFKEPITSDFHITPTNSMATSTLTTVTSAGQIVTFNLIGRITRRDQLYKPVSNTRFFLLKDVLERSFLIVGKADNRWFFMDSNG